MSNTAATYKIGAGRFEPWLSDPVAVDKEPRLKTSCTHWIRSCSIAHQIHVVLHTYVRTYVRTWDQHIVMHPTMQPPVTPMPGQDITCIVKQIARMSVTRYLLCNTVNASVALSNWQIEQGQTCTRD